MLLAAAENLLYQRQTVEYRPFVIGNPSAMLAGAGSRSLACGYFERFQLKGRLGPFEEFLPGEFAYPGFKLMIE